MARTRLQDTALRARDLEQRNHELHAALRVAKHAVLNAPRSPTMIHFEALQKSVSSMEGRHKERERELERMLRGLEDRRDAEMHALKRKVRHATVCLHCVCIRVCIRVLFMYTRVSMVCVLCVSSSRSYHSFSSALTAPPRFNPTPSFASLLHLTASLPRAAQCELKLSAKNAEILRFRTELKSMAGAMAALEDHIPSIRNYTDYGSSSDPVYT